MTANEYGFFWGGWGDKNVLESDSGDGHTTLQIYKKITTLHSLKR